MKIKQLTTLKHKLQWLVLLTSLLGVSQGLWAYTLNSKAFYINTEKWSTPHIHIWNSGNNGYNNYHSLTRISNTGVYYYTASNYNNVSGWNFSSQGSDGGSASDAIYNDLSSYNWFYGRSNTFHNSYNGLNGQMKVSTCIFNESTGQYAETSNSDCSVTMSGIQIKSNWIETQSTSATTSSGKATLYPAYGSTVTFSCSGSNGYVYYGRSTTKQTTLPSVTTATTETSYSYNSTTSVATYYAYFRKQYSISAGVCNSGGGSVKLDNASTPLSKTVDSSVSHSFSATPTSAAFEFVGWYSNADGTGTAVSTSNPYSTTITSTTTLYAKFNNVCGTVSVDPDPDKTVYTSCPGGKTLTVAASGGTGTLTYQWYRNTSDNTSGGVSVTEKYTAAQGGESYTPSALEAGTDYYYYCIVRSSGVCEPYKSATSGTSGRINLNTSAVVMQPAISRVKAFDPVAITSSNTSIETWAISTPTTYIGTCYYLYETSLRGTKFKGGNSGAGACVDGSSAITYKIQATPPASSGLTCPGVAVVRVYAPENDAACN